MTTDIKFKDIVIFGVLIVLIAIVFYYFYKKNASTQAKITQLHNLLNYQQTLIGQSNQSNSAINHEIKMLKSLFKNKENVENIELPDVTAKEYNLDSELKEELNELTEIAEEVEELADETEFEEQLLFENKNDIIDELLQNQMPVKSEEEVESHKEKLQVPKKDTKLQPKKEKIPAQPEKEEIPLQPEKEEIASQPEKEEIASQPEKENVVSDKKEDDQADKSENIIEVDDGEATDISNLD
jgi:hypothetical protein